MKELRSIVSDCGLSQTTLEEVFMIVTGKKIQKEKKELVTNGGYKPPKLDYFDESKVKVKFEETKG